MKVFRLTTDQGERYLIQARSIIEALDRARFTWPKLGWASIREAEFD